MEYAHSIYLTGRSKDDCSFLPPQIASNIESLKRHHPDFSHSLYSDETLREVIKTKFDNDVLHAYDKLIPLAYKADLGRYCLLYEYGGIYSDVSINFYQSFTADMLKNRSIFLFRDAFSHAPWIVSNALLYAKKNLPLFEYVINKVVEHARYNYYGHNPLCPTGPNLLGQAVAQLLDMKEFLTGDVQKINKTPSTHSFVYLFPDGEVFAVRVKHGAGLSSLGSSHNDNYNDHYDRKNIYRSIDFGLVKSKDNDSDNPNLLKSQRVFSLPESILLDMQSQLVELKALTNSKSWRYTSPFRMILRKIRDLK